MSGHHHKQGQGQGGSTESGIKPGLVFRIDKDGDLDDPPRKEISHSTGQRQNPGQMSMSSIQFEKLKRFIQFTILESENRMMARMDNIEDKMNEFCDQAKIHEGQSQGPGQMSMSSSQFEKPKRFIQFSILESESRMTARMDNIEDRMDQFCDQARIHEGKIEFMEKKIDYLAKQTLKELK